MGSKANRNKKARERYKSTIERLRTKEKNKNPKTKNNGDWLKPKT